MKIEYDTEHDLLNIEFLANVPIDDSVEMDGIVIDYAKDKRIVAIEVLDASKRTTPKPLDLIDLAIVRSSRPDAVREEKEAYGRKKKDTPKTSPAPFELKGQNGATRLNGLNLLNGWNVLNGSFLNTMTSDIKKYF